jgi:hypothetical protein
MHARATSSIFTSSCKQGERIAIDVIATLRPHAAMVRVDRGMGALHDKFDLLLERVAASGEGLNKAQLMALLKAFLEEDVAEVDVLQLLLEKAKELSSLKQTLEDRARTDLANRERLERVLSALEAGDYKQADEELERLIVAGAAEQPSAWCPRSAARSGSMPARVRRRPDRHADADRPSNQNRQRWSCSRSRIRFNSTPNRRTASIASSRPGLLSKAGSALSPAPFLANSESVAAATNRRGLQSPGSALLVRAQL